MSQFQSRLKELKERSGKTQARIAEDLGVTPQAFSYYVNGREPDYDVLIRMARYFNVSTDYLLGLSDLPNPETLKSAGNIAQELCSYILSIKDGEQFFKALSDYLLLAKERGVFLATAYLVSAQGLFLSLNGAYELLDSFRETSRFDMTEFINAASFLASNSNFAQRNMHAITSYPLPLFIQIAKEYGNPGDSEAVSSYFESYNKSMTAQK